MFNADLPLAVLVVVDGVLVVLGLMWLHMRHSAHRQRRNWPKNADQRWRPTYVPALVLLVMMFVFALIDGTPAAGAVATMFLVAGIVDAFAEGGTDDGKGSDRENGNFW